MKASKELLMIVMAVTLAGVFLGVGSCKKSGESSSKSGQALAASVELCTHCGQIKGAELCCKPDQTKCSDCGLVKGSPGCCNIPKDATKVELCTKCGQIKGTEVCCKPDQTKCSSCGLTKGSPGCCKIPKT